MALWRRSLTVFSLLFVAQVCFGGDTLQTDVSFPIHYDDQALVVKTSAGTAVIRFRQPIDDTRKGRHFEFRFIGPKGNALRGEGDVFEMSLDGPPNVKSKLQIVADKVTLNWSYGDSERGWIYYVPEDVRIQLVSAKTFEKVDLSRFNK